MVCDFFDLRISLCFIPKKATMDDLHHLCMIYSFRDSNSSINKNKYGPVNCICNTSQKDIQYLCVPVSSFLVHILVEENWLNQIMKNITIKTNRHSQTNFFSKKNVSNRKHNIRNFFPLVYNIRK